MMLMGVYVAVYDWLQQRGRLGEQVEFIFDRQLNKEQTIREMFIEIGNAPEPFTKPFGVPAAPIFKDDKDTPALQAADMLAWHIRRKYADDEAGRPRTLSAANSFLGKPDRRCLHIWDRDRLSKALEYMTNFSNENHMVTPHQGLWFRKNADVLIPNANDKVLVEEDKSESHDPIPLLVIPAREMKRYRLVSKCPNDHTVHLHKSSNRLLPFGVLNRVFPQLRSM
jgi:hypothetical protein